MNCCGLFTNKTSEADTTANRSVDEESFPKSEYMASLSPLSKANTSFCLDLLRNLSEDNNTANIFFSPFSISAVMAMVMMGARGDTATQISECLKTQDCQGEVYTLFAKLVSVLNQPGAAFALNVANRLYGEKSYSFLQEFLTQTRTYFNLELESVDFRNRSEEARIKINSWVEEQTRGLIKDILPPSTVSNMTRMILLNAIYFKGTWDEPFKLWDTQESEFKINKTETKPVQMMWKDHYLPITSIPEGRCQILEKPYKGKEMSMLIFLPDKIEDDTTGLEKLEKLLTYEKFMEWTHPDKMERQYVEVRLPRFKIEQNYDMRKTLISMGMEDAFDETKCDLSGMSGNKELFLSEVFHKAFVEVNEEGTEAAIVSGTAINLCSRETPFFCANHPFLFFIRHNPTMSILFAGRFCSPE
ncbi:PREDICTED: leukocyte elastase inhibitor-like isoform X1 [Cyprinodon variegatus]|uniref:leukocyte elastase inhibitor-like isoform X1 n=1 Tax=Cyprinodon variegatus TaxID=28743 RepID=UPI000742B373|nr:PREDICTED: leukocyte elastase inhibitor-like isoform X1 [Cyprinodon variegatus]